MKVLVVGASGQLGQALVARFAGEHDVTPATRRDVELSDHRALRAFVMDRKPAAVINCAAYTNVDGAEDEQETALDVNAFAVRTLARATTELDAVLIHYSTDFVFSGPAAAPYTEDDPPEPQSVYAQSKLLGEWIAADNPRHYVLRVESLFGGPLARSSVDLIAAAVRAGGQAPVFADRVVSPSFVDDVVDATGHLLRSGSPTGLCVAASESWNFAKSRSRAPSKRGTSAAPAAASPSQSVRASAGVAAVCSGSSRISIRPGGVPVQRKASDFSETATVSGFAEAGAAARARASSRAGKGSGMGRRRYWGAGGAMKMGRCSLYSSFALAASLSSASPSRARPIWQVKTPSCHCRSAVWSGRSPARMKDRAIA